MKSQQGMLEEKVLLQLVEDIGLENTRRFMESLDNEFQKRANNIRQAQKEKAFDQLAAEAHALKSSAQVSGAYKLAEAVIKLEAAASRQDEDAIGLAQQALTLTELTRFAFLDVKLD